MPKASRLTPVFLFMLLSLCGCTFLALQSAYTIRGGYGDYYVVAEPQPMPYFDSVIVVPLTNMIGSRAPNELLQILNKNVLEELRRNGYSTQGNHPIYISGFIIHADEGTLSKDLVARLRISHPHSWQVVRELNLVGKTDGVRNMNAAAAGVAKALIKFLDDNTRKVPTS